MPFYLLTVGILCASTIKVDIEKNRAWNDNDEWAMQQAKEGCQKHYNGRSPCLKRFIKLDGFQNYYAVCGGSINDHKSE